ncbi:L-valine transporter subunit YgaH [Sodalis ligni]|jgi:branched-subunit amino acid transport protein|uniref:Branched-subunit amino acid transport protein AzlD n=1 Tax=Sodalis ligni TaxID=2697027 RepID=A0A4R1NAS1_9GAMM|nr:L-valine transporter subunit YgaH [Sodalis ligni]QWA12188.1 L-valine transporter subunit YgaH [Sodalis ligni]TCL04402.1 branched-subunit amino acid transport protein AzlD [Sodalis ligni]
MSHTVIIIGLVVGLANYLFRYLPLRLGSGAGKGEHYPGRWIGRILDGIGIASICALLVVSSVPDVLRDTHKLVPTLAGFTVLIALFYRTRSIIIATLAGALCYGLVFKFLPF